MMPRSVRAAAALVAILAAGACAPSSNAGTSPSSPSPASSGPDLDRLEAIARARADSALMNVHEADVAFMQGMIHHHAQALEMTALIGDRAEAQAIRQMGLRMEISQRDEIGLMETWLRERGEDVPRWLRPAAEHAGMDHGAMGHEDMASDHRMPGMLTPEQMAALEAARGADFDRLFLELMIQHHLGALAMVRDLYNTPGAAQESTVYKFASEVDADQDIEIRRMRELLAAWR